MPWLEICEVLAEIPQGAYQAVAVRDSTVEVATRAALHSKKPLLVMDEKVLVNDLRLVNLVLVLQVLI